MTDTPVELYRSVRKDDFPDGPIVDDHAVAGVLYPSFEDKVIERVQKGRIVRNTRPADVYPYLHDGESVVDPGGGTSLFDRSETFGTTHWWYFRIPKGTDVPASLRVRFTGRNDRFNADHYQIEAATQRMRVDAFKGALDNFARNAVRKLYEDAH